MRNTGRGVAAAAALMLPIALAGTAVAQQATPVDRHFVAEVSQGGLYEVEAGRVAAMRGTIPVVKDFGEMDTHDHTLVNDNLKRIAAQTGVTIKPGLNAEFTARLNKLKQVPADQFNAYYVNDMKQIHNNDEGVFAKEAQEGSPAYQKFAHQTAVLVEAHIGWLNTLQGDPNNW